MNRITLAHGSGGQAMQDLLREVVLRHFDDPLLRAMEDCARLQPVAGELAFTTDSFVVDPPEFPGGDIGRLAVFGSVNDLAVGGAQPLWLSFSLILEEGLDLERLQRILASAAAAAREAGVRIVAGDTKVVPRGAADQIYINTAAIGRMGGPRLSVAAARPGDAVLLSGDPGHHGAAILAARKDLRLSAPILSDCANLHPLCAAILAAGPGTRCLRDATRGGVAAVLNEMALASACAIRLDEEAVPLDPVVQGLCELLGLDPFSLACEGRLLAVVPAAQAEAVLAAMRAAPQGAGARRIGVVREGPPGRVSMRSALGGERILDMPLGELLPRIC